MKNILMLFISFAIIACGGEDDKKDSSSDSRNKKSDGLQAPSPWYDKQINEFVDNCLRHRDSKSLCMCMVDELSEFWEYEEVEVFLKTEYMEPNLSNFSEDELHLIGDLQTSFTDTESDCKERK